MDYLRYKGMKNIPVFPCTEKHILFKEKMIRNSPG
jgi:hypothetical protein